ncbi:hypothetical protein OOU_Y34scaffold00937g14 [Pyricularia oryzae Y34]|uniref:Calcineurin-like phosphoesterase domain-containing protein n=2 Tax=Pyricularia oryzae TaxID=318829 RepID=Q2KED7_PYRO7|nr:hypothetical protein MGCH7_ch7g1099 [Pyricularia oryzae 70-15]ELQ33467.1 hypothetical protein OOU_Y34scaffold00937g14 [Pyricularia oryzae Y34]
MARPAVTVDLPRWERSLAEISCVDRIMALACHENPENHDVALQQDPAASRCHPLRPTLHPTTTSQRSPAVHGITQFVWSASPTPTTQHWSDQLPPGDSLVHAGDLSQYGTFAEIQAQLTWLAAQPHRHKVVVAGNHDLLLDSDFAAGASRQGAATNRG